MPKSFPVTPKLVYKRLDAYKIDSVFANTLRGSSIVHLAADVSVEKSVRDPRETVKSNIGVTCALLEFARRVDCEKFVLSSTAAVYGDRPRACVETDPLSPESPYAVSKVACEYYCRLYSRLYGIPTVILRLFNVYGPNQSGQYAGVITRFMERATNGKPPIIFGDGLQTRDFVYIDDVVESIGEALRKPLRGGTALNIGSGKPISINSLAALVLGLFGLHQRVLREPPRMGDIRHSVADISRARQLLGFRPKHELQNGLRKTLEWFRTREKAPGLSRTITTAN